MKQLIERRLDPWGDPWGEMAARRRARARSKPVCPQCGGRIIAEPTAAARVIECVCVVCGSQLVLTRQAHGDIRVSVGTVDHRVPPSAN